MTDGVVTATEQLYPPGRRRQLRSLGAKFLKIVLSSISPDMIVLLATAYNYNPYCLVCHGYWRKTNMCHLYHYLRRKCGVNDCRYIKPLNSHSSSEKKAIPSTLSVVQALDRVTEGLRSTGFLFTNRYSCL